MKYLKILLGFFIPKVSLEKIAKEKQKRSLLNYKEQAVKNSGNIFYNETADEVSEKNRAIAKLGNFSEVSELYDLRAFSAIQIEDIEDYCACDFMPLKYYKGNLPEEIVKKIDKHEYDIKLKGLDNYFNYFVLTYENPKIGKDYPLLLFQKVPLHRYDTTVIRQDMYILVASSGNYNYLHFLFNGFKREKTLGYLILCSFGILLFLFIAINANKMGNVIACCFVLFILSIIFTALNIEI